MTGEKLHRFDLQLSGYALSSINQYTRFGNERYIIKHLKKWLRQHPLWTYVGPDRLDEREDWPEQRFLLLTDDDFECLVTGLSPLPACYVWLADDHLHRRHVHSITEIREALTPTTAEQWAAASVRLGAELERPKLHVADGMRLVHEWAAAARRLLTAIGAFHFLPPPDGTFSTPPETQPGTEMPMTVTASVLDLSAAEQRALDTMRKAIREASKGKLMSPDGLISRVGINRKHGRDALRRLEQLGEYCGFRRKKPQRYLDGRRNERRRDGFPTTACGNGRPKPRCRG